jgi:predicted chitinase
MKALRSVRYASVLVLNVALLSACGAKAGDEKTRDLDSRLVVEGAACKVVYDVPSAWDSGFTGNVTLTNKGAAIGSWNLEWDFTGTQSVTSSWNGQATQSGSHVTVGAASWNGALASGADASFGFNGTFSGSNPSPTNFKLNGVACSGGTAQPPVTTPPPPPPVTPPPTTPPPATPPVSTPPASPSPSSCNLPAWQAGHNYVTGDQVLDNGNAYVATHDNPGYDPTISTWFWSPIACTGGTSGGGTSTGGGTGATGFTAIVSEATFNSMFPSRNGFYTYQGLVNAIGSFPAFANSGSSDTQKREAAAFLANMAHETGDLVFIEEVQKAAYCSPSASCPCAPGQEYYGRGPIQLSWNYNYCAAGAALGLPLQSDPGLVARDSKVAWQTGLWFWMTQTGAGSMTAHSAIVNGAGFGETIRTINGGLECNGNNTGEMQSRINYYTQFCSVLGVSPGNATGC